MVGSAALVEPSQYATSVLALLAASMVCSAYVFQRGVSRRWGYAVLSVCAFASMVSWLRFGQFHSIFVDTDGSSSDSRRPKVEIHRPFHFHEFFHYYLGAKYFREVGYIGLYDCTALADHEIAAEDRVVPRIQGYVRDLDDVLLDKPNEAALDHCRSDARPRFSTPRWAAFKSDIRELRRMVPDDWWNGAVSDAGFNPPPSWVVLGNAVANVIPIRAGGFPFYLVATSLDLALLALCFVGLRTTFGATTAAVAAVFFGTSFISHFGWNGGAFLRFTWLTSVTLSLCALKRGHLRWAGALLGAATCDRLFPAGFAVFAVVPMVAQGVHSTEARQAIARLAGAFAITVVGLVVLSAAIFGTEAWAVFFSRIGRHSDIYFVMHIGLKKVLTFHDWTVSQNFRGHEGLLRFRAWNLRLRDAWSQMHWLAWPIQALAVAGAVAAVMRRRPDEAALLGGVVFMFVFNLPANYYYAVLALVPALILRSAATARANYDRGCDFTALMAFSAFWMLTLIAPHLSSDDIVYNHDICLGLAVFLVVWIAAWIAPRWGAARQVTKRLEALAGLA